MNGVEAPVVLPLAALLKGFYKALSGILTDSCVLEELFTYNLNVFQTGG